MICFCFLPKDNASILLSFPCRLVRFGQVYNFPILLAESIVPSAMFYGTVVPLLAYWSVKVLVVNPFMEKEEER